MTSQTLPLPYELRLRIYELLLICPSQPIYAYRQISTGRTHLGISSATLLVSRQIYEEASPVLYDKNRFKFELHDILRSANVAADTPTVRCCFGLRDQDQAMVRGATLSRMRHVEINVAYDAVFDLNQTSGALTRLGEVFLPQLLDFLTQKNSSQAYDSMLTSSLKFVSTNDLDEHRSILGWHRWGKQQGAEPRGQAHRDLENAYRSLIWSKLMLVAQIREIEVFEANRLLLPDDEFCWDYGDDLPETADLWLVKDLANMMVIDNEAEPPDTGSAPKWSDPKPFKFVGTFLVADM